MRRFALASLLALVPLSAVANPGDPRIVQGVLVWSAAGNGAPFVVVRGDDGRHYVADVSATQRRGDRPVNPGDRVSLVGVEGPRPWEMSTMVLGLGDSALAALPPADSASPAASPPMTPAPGRPAVRSQGPERPAAAARSWRRIHGRVDSISGKTVRLRDSDGRSVTVDVSPLKGSAETVLRPGAEATLFVVAESGDQLVAVGLVQTDTAQPSASPRQPR